MPKKFEAIVLAIYAGLFIVLALVFNVKPSDKFPFVYAEQTLGKVLIWFYVLTIPVLLYVAIVQRYLIPLFKKRSAKNK